MKRAILIVLDSLGIGSAADAKQFSDEGSNTLGHIAERFALKIPTLTKLGMVSALKEASGSDFGLEVQDSAGACYAIGEEISSGKDTVSGHWEIAGCPVTSDWGYFKELTNSFPQELTDRILKRAGLKGFLGNCHASGTEIIERLGEEHIKTGFPVFYTSADSVFQIAAHEQHFGLEKLYELCQIAREEVDNYNICRVIARPFVGADRTSFTRTANRKDYAVPPFTTTLLSQAKAEGASVVAIGKIGDIYAHVGVTHYLKTPWNKGNIEDILTALQDHKERSLIFANLSDFDVLYGHRRNPQGYGEAINYFDQRLPEIISLLKDEDLLIVTADHGNDPTWKGTDHTREYIPILIYKKDMKPKYLGKRSCFADIGQTLAEHLGLKPLPHGQSFYKDI